MPKICESFASGLAWPLSTLLLNFDLVTVARAIRQEIYVYTESHIISVRN